MKKILKNRVLLIVVIFFSSCKEIRKESIPIIIEHVVINPELTIKIDTLDIFKDGFLRKVVLYQDKYFCFFRLDKGYKVGYENRLFILKQNGTVFKDILVPKEISNIRHYDLTVKNNKLYIKNQQFDKANYLIENVNYNFIKEENKNFEIFQDETFLVYSDCSGEFGGTVFFKNKKTQQLYEISAVCSVVVNKLKDDYYITNYLDWTGLSTVLKISNPSKLKKSNWDYHSELISYSNQGAEIILDKSNLNIHTSFVKNEKLYYLYTQDNQTYIGLIENNKMKKQYSFEFQFSPQFNQQLGNRKQILSFYVPNTKQNGILVIDDGILNFKYLNI